ncbi:MAG: FeoB small GTPase domain-containing protein, partial [Phenylobacterium sp.]
MSDAVLPPARVALVGNPNSGKTALFNALTGSRQKVANYAGVT